MCLHDVQMRLQCWSTLDGCPGEEATESQEELCGKVFELGPKSKVGFGLEDERKSGRGTAMSQDWEQGSNSNNNDNDNNNNNNE